MEALYDEGLAKHIGVANYNCQSLRDLLNYARIKPSVLQVEEIINDLLLYFSSILDFFGILVFQQCITAALKRD